MLFYTHAKTFLLLGETLIVESDLVKEIDRETKRGRLTNHQNDEPGQIERPEVISKACRDIDDQ